MNVQTTRGRATVPLPNSGTRCVETSGRVFLKMWLSNHLLDVCGTYKELVKAPIQTMLGFWVIVTMQGLEHSLIPSVHSWFTLPASANLQRIWGSCSVVLRSVVSCKAFACLSISCWPRAVCYSWQGLSEEVLMTMTLVLREEWYLRALLCRALWPASLEGCYTSVDLGCEYFWSTYHELTLWLR